MIFQDITVICRKVFLLTFSLQNEQPMESTLLLNASYEPLRVLHWQKAITLLWREKVEVLEVHEQKIRGASSSIPLPSVVRLHSMIRLREKHRTVKFSRVNIFTRDGYSCQYCAKVFRPSELTFDHILPISRGGRKTWENIVAACWRCNSRKSGRTPKEAGMRLLKKPVRPRWTEVVAVTSDIRGAPESWRDYLEWNTKVPLAIGMDTA